MTRQEQKIEKRRSIYQAIMKDCEVSWEIVGREVCFYVKKDGQLLTEVKHLLSEYTN